MASPTALPGSGGKMTRTGRRQFRRTPYERPPPPPLRGDSSPEPNPNNWISRLIISPTRMLATGAGKVLSSVFGPESDSDSESEEEAVDDEVDGDYGDDVSADGVDEKNQTSQVANDLSDFEWKSETKRLLAQLIIQQTFSREECNILTELVESRVVDSSMAGAMVGSEDDMTDLRSNAIVEAKRWLEEKKNSRPELEHGICTLNTAMTLDGSEGEVGSPADVAKSYMQSRPPWASPSLSPTQYNSSSLLGGQLFKQDSPYALGGYSSKLKWESPTSGSWSILEEVRKVRAKATEEMLKSRPISTIDLSSSALELNRRADLVVVDGVETVPPIAHDGLQSESPNLAATLPGSSQDMGLRPISQGTGELSYDQMPDSSKELMTISNSYATITAADGVTDNGGKIQPLSSLIDGTVPDSRVLEHSRSRPDETIEEGVTFAANGFVSGSSLSAAKDTEGKSMPSEKENNQATSDQDEMKRNAPLVESHKHLGEDSVEVQVVYAVESATSKLLNSSSARQQEKLSKDLPKRVNSKRKVSNDVAEKQRVRKLGRHQGRGRGRGK